MRISIKSKKKSVLLLFIALAIIISLSLTTVIVSDEQENTVEGGVFRLSKNDESIQSLCGQWMFCWNEFMNADEITQTCSFDDVPSTWSNHTQESNPGFGAATYAVRITGAKAGECYSLRIPSLHLAYRCYINDELIYSLGKASITKDEYSSQIGIGYPTFTAPSESFMLTLHISNYDHSRGGVWSAVQIAQGDTMQSARALQSGYDYTALFILVLLFVFSFIMMMLSKDYLEGAMYIAIILTVFLMHITSGDKLIMQWFPHMSASFFMRIQYIVLFMLPPMMVWQIYIFCSERRFIKTNKYLFFAIFGSGFVLFVITIVSPIWFFTSLANIGYVLSIIHILLSVILVTLAMIKAHQKKGLLFYLGACVVMGTSAIIDFLKRFSIINGAFEWMTLGFIIASLLIGANMMFQIIHSRQEAFIYRQAYLIAQLKPHFIFNALNTVIGTIKEDAEQAERLAHAFSAFLRSAIDQQKLSGSVSLEQEIETVKAYLEIEIARNQNIDARIDFDEIPSIELPPFTLQPLAENAIKHGLSPKGGSITISVQSKKNEYILSVCDNGIGIPKEELNKIRKSLESPSELREGIGLSNVNERFFAMHGKPIEINSKPNEGTCVNLYVPLKPRRHFNQ